MAINSRPGPARAGRTFFFLAACALQLIPMAYIASGDPTPLPPPTEIQAVDNSYTVDHITLFYHDDPVQLVEAITGKQAAKVASRTTIAEIYDVDGLSANVTIQQGAVDSLQTLLRQLEAQLTPALNARAQADAKKQQATAAYKTAQKDQKLAKQRFTIAEAKLALEPGSEELRRDVEIKRQDLALQDVRVIEAEHAQTLADDEYNTANTEVTALNTNLGLNQTKVKEISGDLQKARVKLGEERSKLVAASRKETLQFGRIRDEPPVYTSVLKIASPGKPEASVRLAAMPDSRSIVLTGPAPHVAMIAGWIEKFDRPQPQAMLTLWTLEMSSQATDCGAESTERALTHVNDKLRQSRKKIDSYVSDSRGTLLNCVAHLASAEARIDHFYDPAFLALMGGATAPTVKKLLPDPGRVSSLAEVITVGILAKPEIYQKIFPRNGSGLLSAPARILDEVPNSPRALVGIRLEFATAVRDWIVRRQYQRVQSLLWTYKLKTLEVAQVDADTTLTPAQKKAKIHFLMTQAKFELTKMAEPLNNLSAMRPQNELATLAGFVTRLSQSSNLHAPDPNLLDAAIKILEHKLDRSSPDGLFIGHEATLNEFLKKLVFSTEDIVQGEVIEPMYLELSKQLREQDGLSVGVLQRTSLLASNRLIARTDPRATASVPLGDEQDILGAALQLADILSDVKTGGILSALEFQRDRDERTPRKPEEIYGLTTGNRFQVRPILDPTGQALRFRFDYLGETVVKDPDSTSNPRLSHIERHTTNTEVQLSNFEIREISRFQTNAKLGLPEKRFGGIPILNEIPGIREIPLIGWFSRQWDEDPTVQSSLILAQTNIYPTIDFILRRLTEGN